MFTTIVAAIAAIAGGITIYNNWDSVKSWINEFIDNLRHLFATTFKAVAHATAVFVRIIRNGVAEIIHRTYVPTEDNEFGEVITRKVTSIPAWAQREIEQQQMNGSEVKVTPAMASKLGILIH